MTPYSRSARIYVEGGWSPVPMTGGDDRTAKGRPYVGTTGKEGALIDAALVEDAVRSAEAKGYPDVSLRLHRVIGIDIDQGYAKSGTEHVATGRATLEMAEAMIGTLPPTFSSTARGWESGSRIQLYRLPDDVPDDAILGEARTIGLFGGYVEIIRFGHRYVKCWPTVHPNGQVYRWYFPDGREMPEDIVPSVASLAELPRAWAQFLTDDIKASVTAPRGQANGGDGGDPSSDRVFTAPEAERFVAGEGLDALKASGWDEGQQFNGRLNKAAFTLGRFVPEIWSEAEAREMLYEVIAAVSGGADADGQDLATIKSGLDSGMKLQDWRPRMPTDNERSNAFSKYYNGPVEAPRALAAAIPGETRTVPVAPVGGETRTLFVDLKALMAGGTSGPKPSVMHRRDGAALFYAGAVNVIFGDPECGKTMVALGAVASVLSGGGKACFVDLDHNGAASIVARLVLLGASEEVLTDQTRFKFAEPDDSEHLDDVVKALAPFCDDRTTVVIDSLGELIPMYGGNSNDADDYSRVHRRALTPLADAGACVIAIDHQAKNADSRQFGATGSGAKKRAIDGSYVKAVAGKQLTEGTGGTVKLYVYKDRHSGLRRECEQVAQPMCGTFVMETDFAGTRWHVADPQESDKAKVVDLNEYAASKPERDDNKVYVALHGAPAPLSQRQVIALSRVGKEPVIASLDRLIERGIVRVEAGPNRSLLYSVVPRNELPAMDMNDAIDQVLGIIKCD